MSRPSLAGRLLRSSLLGLALLLPLGGLALSWGFRRSAEAAFDERLDAWAQAVVAALAVDRDGRLVAERPGDPRFERPLSGWYWEARAGAARLAASRSLWDAELPALAPLASGAPRHATIVGPRGRSLRAIVRRVTLPGVDETVDVVVAGDDAALRREIRRFDTLLLAALGGLGAAVLGLGALQMRIALRPLQALARELGEVREGERETVGEGAPRELAPLADALNALLARDAELVRRARDQAADLAHALKTPLTLIRAEGEELGGEVGARLIAQADTMARHLERRLARAPRPAVAGARTPVAPVLEAIAETLRRLHPACTIELDAPAHAVFRGAREDLEEIAGNLLENACKWARRRVRAQARAPGDGLELVVEDDGPGLAPEARERALARGGRLDERAPGSGLGLAIVQELAAAHGGTLRLEASALGGLRAVVA
ncbi:MAG TPA: sensor histidine kinase, partial [Myxococcota bacterium]